MRRTVSTCVVVITALLVAVPTSAPATSSSGPQAGAARGCTISRYEQTHLGTTYARTLRVSGTTCANGKRVVKAFHACRKANGGRDGRCRSRVLRYRCTESRSNVIPSQFDGRVTCKRPGREVSHKYTQNT